MASKDTYEDSFRVSGFTYQGNPPSDEVRWEVFPNKRISALCSSQTQAIGNFCYFFSNKEEARFNEKILSFAVI